MIRTALRGLRGRLLLSFVATSVVTLLVAAAITLGPLQSRLRSESETALQQATEETRYDFGTALDKTANRKGDESEAGRQQRRATALGDIAPFLGPLAQLGTSGINCRTSATLSASLRPRNARAVMPIASSSRSSPACTYRG